MTKYLQFQIFLGPRVLPSSDGANYQYYLDLPALGATLNDLDYQTAVATTLASGATSLVTTNDALLYGAFPNDGGLWVGPNGASQGWEHVTYDGRTTYTFNNLEREDPTYREHDGVHTVGAEVRFWYPVETDNGNLNLIDQLAEDFQARFWRLELGGFALPASLLRNNHFVAVVYRTAPSGDWLFYALGMTNSVQIRDDYERKGEWILYATSLHGWAESTVVHGVHIGDINVAPYGQAQSSPELGSPYKDLLSGDYDAANPDFSAKSAIDGDMDTLWIADRVVGTEVTVTYEGVTQLYLNPHPGRGPSYKWIELTNYYTDQTSLAVWDPDENAEYFIEFEAVPSYDEGDDYRVILTDDPVAFARENPASTPALIVRVPSISGFTEFLSHCKPHGGAMAVKDLFGGYTKPIVWGTVGFADPQHEGVDWWDSSDWTGASIDAPGYGQVIAAKHGYVLAGGENTKNAWEVRDLSYPGYGPRNSDEINDGYGAWLTVYLPGLGLVLRDDISAVDTTLYVVDSAGEPSTEGLPDSGTLQIGSEQITYTGKAEDSLTGCTVTDNHSAGDILQVVENGIATDGFPITYIRLRRGGGTIYPKDFYVRWSRILTRLPTQSGHEDDFDAPYGGTHQATTNVDATYTVDQTALGGSPVRCRTVMVEFYEMTTNPHYAKLNELEVVAHSDYFSDDYFVDGPANAGQIIRKFFNACGIQSGAVDESAVTRTLSKSFRTGRENAWRMILDFADMCGLFVNCRRDFEAVITENSFWSTAVGGYASTYSWDEDDVVYVDRVSRLGAGVGQIRLAWEAYDGSDSGSVVYPASVGVRGGIEDIGPYFFADATAAELAARKRYWLRQAPDYIVVELDDVDLGIRPGEIFNLSWQFPEENMPHDRQYIIVGVDVRVSEQVATMVVTGLQIDREVTW